MTTDRNEPDLTALRKNYIGLREVRVAVERGDHTVVLKKTGEVAVPAEDVKLVEAALGRHPHLRCFKTQAVENAVVIFEPDPRRDGLRGRHDRWILWRRQPCSSRTVEKRRTR